MLGGYFGKILWVDLSKSKTHFRSFDNGMVRRYIGGVGVAARILWDETTANTDPLSQENPLMFMVGPLTGLVPSSSRCYVVALSPLTDIYGESHFGGSWADEFKRAGLDGMVIKGSAEKPVYLWVSEGEAEIRDGKFLWGKDITETDKLVKNETDKRASVCAIGPAGERLVRISSIIAEGKAARAAARCGIGAVMGSKNLKAVAVRGKRTRASTKIYNNEKLMASVKEFWKMNSIYGRYRTGTARAAKALVKHRKTHETVGLLPVKNFSESRFPGFVDKMTNAFLSGKPYFCRTCGIGLHECLTEEKTGLRMATYQAYAPLGSICLVDDMDAIEKASILCNTLGMDTISTGVVVAFAMECFEKGLINKKDTDGIDLNWGNSEAMVEMVRRIAYRKGLGELLGEGVRRAAQRLGGNALECAMHVKGLEVAGHDPRAINALALDYATANEGANHMSAMPYYLLHYKRPPSPHASEIQRLDGAFEGNPFALEGMAEVTVKLQNFVAMTNCIGICNVAHFRTAPHLDWLNFVTGLKLSWRDYMKTGERVFNLKRMINVRRGISRKDDILPSRILTQKGPAPNVPPLDEMLDEYYVRRGWTENGIPTAEKLQDLNLEDLTSSHMCE